MILSKPKILLQIFIMVRFFLSRGRLGRARMRRLIEYKASIMRMPERIPGIFSFVVRIPVQKPAREPAAPAIRIARKGLNPLKTRSAHTQPPRAKLPSTVMSAKSRILNVMYTPRAMMPQSTPCATAPNPAPKKI